MLDWLIVKDVSKCVIYLPLQINPSSHEQTSTQHIQIVMVNTLLSFIHLVATSAKTSTGASVLLLQVFFGYSLVVATKKAECPTSDQLTYQKAGEPRSQDQFHTNYNHHPLSL